jgi:hypothetical protein
VVVPSANSTKLASAHMHQQACSAQLGFACLQASKAHSMCCLYYTGAVPYHHSMHVLVSALLQCAGKLFESTCLLSESVWSCYLSGCSLVSSYELLGPISVCGSTANGNLHAPARSLCKHV